MSSTKRNDRQVNGWVIIENSKEAKARAEAQAKAEKELRELEALNPINMILDFWMGFTLPRK